jgi:hypothetical protein
MAFSGLYLILPPNSLKFCPEDFVGMVLPYIFSHINFAPKWMDEGLNSLTIATANVGV